MWLSILIILSTSKYIQGEITLTKKFPWRYLSRFGFDHQKADWTLRLKLYKPFDEDSDEEFELIVHSYREPYWEELKDTPTCEDYERESNKNYPLNIPLDGTWSETLSAETLIAYSPEMWYIAVSDCKFILPKKMQLSFELEFTHQEKFSIEDYGIDKILEFLLVVFGLLFVGQLIAFKRFRRRSSESVEHLIVFLSAIGVETVSIIFMSFHLYLFSEYGVGSPFLHFCSVSLREGGWICISYLLLLLGDGWTFTKNDIPKDEIFLPCGILSFVTELFIIGIGKIKDDTYYKFTEYDDWVGTSLLIFKLSVGYFFLVQIKTLYFNVKVEKLVFAITLGIVGAIHFMVTSLSIPLSWTFSNFSRKYYLYLIIYCEKVFLIIYLNFIFKRDGSHYRNSVMSSTILGNQDKTN